jgi:hypothetical protein
MKTTEIRIMAFAACALAVSAAHADDYTVAGDQTSGGYISPTEERVRLSLGVMRTSAATTVRIDPASGTLGTGTVIDGENDLGLDHYRFGPKFQAMVRVEERHRLRFDYFILDRSDEKTLAASAAPITFGNSTLSPGNPVQTDLSLRALGITYGYSFLHRQNFELAGTVGVNVVDISARARVLTQTRHLDQSDDVAGPFPVIGLDATWVLSKRFYVDGRAQYFKVSVSNLNGSLGMYEFAGLYRFRPNVSFALGYALVRAHLASTQSTQPGLFDFDAKGPELFVRVAF